MRAIRVLLLIAAYTAFMVFGLPVLFNAAVPPLHAQSRLDRAWAADCRRLADSVSFVVGQTQAGATDAQIQSDMLLYRLRPLDDNLRTVLEQNAHLVTMNESYIVTLRNCMQQRP